MIKLMKFLSNSICGTGAFYFSFKALQQHLIFLLIVSENILTGLKYLAFLKPEVVFTIPIFPMNSQSY